MQVLEGILDDDADMADMYLARRAQLAANNAANATQQRADCDNSPNAPHKSGMLAPPCASQPCFSPSCFSPSFQCTHHSVVFAGLFFEGATSMDSCCVTFLAAPSISSSPSSCMHSHHTTDESHVSRHHPSDSAKTPFLEETFFTQKLWQLQTPTKYPSMTW